MFLHFLFVLITSLTWYNFLNNIDNALAYKSPFVKSKYTTKAGLAPWKYFFPIRKGTIITENKADWATKWLITMCCVTVNSVSRRTPFGCSLSFIKRLTGPRGAIRPRPERQRAEHHHVCSVCLSTQRHHCAATYLSENKAALRMPQYWLGEYKGS